MSGDPMTRLLEGLEKVIRGNKPEEVSKTNMEVTKWSLEIGCTASRM